MDRITSVLFKPLAARLGALAAGGLAGFATFDPALSGRVEAWVAATVLLGVDLIGAYLRSNKQEGR